MREETKDYWRLRHILESIDRIVRYINDLEYDAFIEDDMRYYAVIKNIEIIGEAANMLTHTFRESYSNIPWKAICGMRNYIVHEYFAVDSVVVWDVIKNDLPKLYQEIVAITSSLTPDSKEI